MRPIDVSGFEQKFRENIDPWNYTQSRFERYKRTILLRACGRYKHGRVLELGCAIGETSRYLAPLSLRLIAVDGSSTAINEATKRLGYEKHVHFRLANLPGEMPRGPFELIVVSEIAYYLRLHQLATLGQRIIKALAPRGRVVALHHRRQFDDAAQLPALAHLRLRTQLARSLSIVASSRYPQFDIVTLEKGRKPAIDQKGDP